MSLKPIKSLQVTHDPERSPDHRTWVKYAESTFYLTSQWWVLGNDTLSGDALCGVGKDGDVDAVVRVGDEIAEDRGAHASLTTALAKLGYQPEMAR